MNINESNYFKNSCINYGDDIYLLEENQALSAQQLFPMVAGREIKTDKIVFLMCQRGNIDLKLNYHRLHIESDTVLIILPGMIIETLAVSSDVEVLTMLLSEQFTESLDLNNPYRVRLSIKRQPFQKLLAGMGPAFKNLYRMVRGIMEQPSHPYIDRVLHLLFEAYFYGIGPYLHNSESQCVSTAAELHTEQFLRLVERNFQNQYSLDWYAEQLNITPKRLSICVKNTSERTPTEWINQHRLLEADKLLRNGTLSIKEIASKLGFPNQSAFGTWFKSHTGKSPSKYVDNYS